MFEGFPNCPLWANLYRQELAKETGRPIIQELLNEDYREPQSSSSSSSSRKVPGQEFDTKHGMTIVKSIVEGVNYRYDDGSSTKDLIKELKLLPRSVKEASVRLNHFGKDFIRSNISHVKHANVEPSPASPDRPIHSLHLYTTHAADSPTKHGKTLSPSSPSQLDPFLALIPSHRQSHVREACQLFNSSVSHTADFRARHSSNMCEVSSPLKRDSSPKIPSNLPLKSESRPVTAASFSASPKQTSMPSHSVATDLKVSEDLKTEMLFKRLTQENPNILEKIKAMYIARNFSKQGASGYKPRKQNYMQMSNNDAIEMLRRKIAQKLSSGPGELRRSFELFDRDGSGKVDIAELSEVLGMFNINLPPDQVFSLMCQFGSSDGEIDFNTFIKTVLAPVKVIETIKIGARSESKQKTRQFLVGKNWINMHNDQVIAVLRQRVYQLYGFQGIQFTLNALFRHYSNNSPLMSAAELHETLRCFSLDVPPEQCADIIRDFMRDHKDSNTGGLDHAEFVKFILEIDNPDEFTHIGAASMLSRGLRLTYNDDEKHAARIEQLKVLKERKNAEAAGDIEVLVKACRHDASGIHRMEKALRMKDVGRSGTINLKHFIDIVTEIFAGAVTVTNARRLAGIFDEHMVGYVDYEQLLDKIRQQVALPRDVSTPLPVTPGDLRSPSLGDIKARHSQDQSIRDLADSIRRKISSKLRSSASEFRVAFEMVDRDGSGYVSVQELQHIVARVLNIEVPQHLSRLLFASIDRSGDGRISFVEFSRFFESTALPSPLPSRSPAPRTPSIVAIRPFEGEGSADSRRPKTSSGGALSPFAQRKAELDLRASLRTPLSRAKTPLI